MAGFATEGGVGGGARDGDLQQGESFLQVQFGVGADEQNTDGLFELSGRNVGFIGFFEPSLCFESRPLVLDGVVGKAVDETAQQTHGASIARLGRGAKGHNHRDGEVWVRCRRHRLWQFLPRGHGTGGSWAVWSASQSRRQDSVSGLHGVTWHQIRLGWESFSFVRS